MLYVLFLFALIMVGCTEGPAQSKTEDADFALLVDSTFFEEHFKTSQVKIVFRDDMEESLDFLEIDGNSYKLTKFDIDLDPYHPQFSPDGSKIAFSTGMEGVPGASSLYVIDISTSDYEIHKLDGANAGVPRWRVLENGDTVIVYNDFVGSDRSFEWDSSATYQVTYSANKFGVPEKIMNRSYNGGVSYDNEFAVTGAPRLLFHHASDDDDVNPDMYNDEQVCNASLSRDSSKIASFLETTGKFGVEYTGESDYYWHQYVLYMNTDGKIIKAIKGERTGVFEHVEWLFYPGYQIATVSKMGASEHMVVIDYEGGTYHKILQALGMQLMHPDLWVPQK